MTKFNTIIDELFYKCVDILVIMAKYIGISYELINILIFIIGYPFLVIILLWIILFQRKKLFKLGKKFNG